MLSFKTYGSKQNQAIVFLHGLFGSKDDFHLICNSLSDRYYCIAVDLPGFGSSFVDLSIPLKAYIEEQLIQLTQIAPSFHLAGYSLGGRIALDFFSRHPHLISSLMVLSANIGIKEEEKSKKQEQMNDLIYRVQTQPAAYFLNHWYQQPLFNTLQSKEELRSSIIKKRSSYDKEVVIAYLFQLSILQQEDFHFILPKIKHGVFFYGESDVYYKTQYNRLSIYNSSLQIEEINESSHAIVEENGAVVADKMRYFLERLK